MSKNEKKQMKDTQNEIKQNIQGTNRDSKDARTKAMICNKRKKTPFNWNRIKKQEYEKVKRDLQTSGTT